MRAFNPIIEGYPPVQPTEVPQYVLDARQELAIWMKRKIKRKKVPKTPISKQKTLTHKKISSKAFNSFIDTGYKKETKELRNMYGFLLDAEKDLKELIELGKVASNKDDLVLADTFYELIELKQKELEIIYKYRANKTN